MSDPAYTVLGSIVFWSAVATASASVLFDWVVQRYKHRRRCPRCWYDMSHSPGLTCSECGHDAKRERRLHKSRRRWKLLALALLLLACSHFLHAAPRVKQRGWPAAVPTTAMLLASPWIQPDKSIVASNLFGQQAYRYMQNLPHPVFYAKPVLPSMDWQTELFLELAVHRLDGDQLRAWEKPLVELAFDHGAQAEPGVEYEWDSLSGRLLATTRWSDGSRAAWTSEPVKPQDFTITTRPVWPIGAPVYARVQTQGNVDRFVRWKAAPSLSGVHSVLREQHPIRSQMTMCGGVRGYETWDDHLECLGSCLDSGSLDFELTVLQGDSPDSSLGGHFGGPLIRWFPTETRGIHVAITADSVSDVLTPVPDRQFEEAIPSIFQPGYMNGGRVGSGLGYLELRPNRGLFRSHLKRMEDVTIALKAVVICNDSAVAEGVIWFWNDIPYSDPSGFGSQERIKMKVLDEPVLHRPPAGSRWSLQLSGDPMTALRNFKGDRYWEGTATIPLKVNMTARTD